MKCLILAAGYATRLYPLTESFPKPLLKVGDKAIIDWIIEDLQNNAGISEFIVISNDKFYNIFCDWKKEKKISVRVINDGTTSNDNRLGAVKDIAFAVEKCNLNEDLLVVAGDNLTDFSLNGFLEYYNKKNATCVMRHFEQEVCKLRKTGVITIDIDESIIQMQEKPNKPLSNWAVPPFYIYKMEDLIKLKYAVENQICNVDAPGDFLAWLCMNSKVYAYEMPGRRYDIGDIESYEYIQREYKGIVK